MIDLKYNPWCLIQPSILAENAITTDLHKDLIQQEWGLYTITVIDKDLKGVMKCVYSFKDQHVLVEIQYYMVNYKYWHNILNKDKDDIRPRVINVKWYFVDCVQTINWIKV